jgi:hypothetical protein
VRRAEQKGQPLLRGTRYLWLRNPANLSDRQQAALDSLPTRHLKTGLAHGTLTVLMPQLSQRMRGTRALR